MSIKRSKAPSRHGFSCHYCGVPVFSDKNRTWDHIVPKALGGTDSMLNLITSCAFCNQAKGDDMPTCQCAFCRTAVNYWESIGGLSRVPKKEEPQFKSLGQPAKKQKKRRPRNEPQNAPPWDFTSKAPPVKEEFVSRYTPNPNLKFEPPPQDPPETHPGSPFYPNYD